MYKFKLSDNEIHDIRQILSRPDGLIAFPTDTVWGVGCLVENKAAVERIYSVKGRDKSKPLILLGSKIEYLLPFIETLPEKAQEIITQYLPGAVTVVLPKSNKTPDYITSGFNTIGIRIPDCPPFLELLDRTVNNHVLATTSANISGMGANKTKLEVQDSIGNEVDYILDDYGFIPKGAESTVLAVNEQNEIKIFRQGAITIEI